MSSLTFHRIQVLALTLLIGLSLSACAASSGSLLHRPEGWSDLPRSQRAPVWEIDLSYEPVPDTLPPLQGARVLVLSPVNSNHFIDRIETPAPDLEEAKSLTVLGPEDRARVVHLQGVGRDRNKKPNAAILSSDPLPDAMQAGLVRELASLGLDVVRSSGPPVPVSAPADEILKAVEDASLETPPDFVVISEIREFFSFDYYAGVYYLPSGTPMGHHWVDGSYLVAMKVWAYPSGELLWDDAEKLTGHANITLGSYPEFILGSYRNLIERVLRKNPKLQDRMATLGTTRGTQP